MDIISEIRNAPEEGAKRLEREYKARLLAVAMNLCHDEHEAESLVYDTMGKAVAEIKSLSKPDALFSWMCSILVNTHNKATRRKSNENVFSTDNLPEETVGAESVFNSVDETFLHEAIAELPEKLRDGIACSITGEEKWYGGGGGGGYSPNMANGGKGGDAARHYIYNYPYANQFYAIVPGFTEGLLKLAQEVRGLASTPGEKARAEVLLRHFERLDCMAAFKGVAYMNPMSCELDSAADAAKGWADVEFSVSGAQLGKKRGKYLLILFKMQGTDAVAVSTVSWKVNSGK